MQQLTSATDADWYSTREKQDIICKIEKNSVCRWCRNRVKMSLRYKVVLTWLSRINFALLLSSKTEVNYSNNSCYSVSHPSFNHFKPLNSCSFFKKSVSPKILASYKMLFQSVIKVFQFDILKHKYFCSFPIPCYCYYYFYF